MADNNVSPQEVAPKRRRSSRGGVTIPLENLSAYLDSRSSASTPDTAEAQSSRGSAPPTHLTDTAFAVDRQRPKRTASNLSNLSNPPVGQQADKAFALSTSSSTPSSFDLTDPPPGFAPLDPTTAFSHSTTEEEVITVDSTATTPDHTNPPEHSADNLAFMEQVNKELANLTSNLPEDTVVSAPSQEAQNHSQVLEDVAAVLKGIVLNVSAQDLPLHPPPMDTSEGVQGADTQQVPLDLSSHAPHQPSRPSSAQSSDVMEEGEVAEELRDLPGMKKWAKVYETGNFLIDHHVHIASYHGDLWDNARRYETWSEELRENFPCKPEFAFAVDCFHDPKYWYHPSGGDHANSLLVQIRNNSTSHIYPPSKLPYVAVGMHPKFATMENPIDPQSSPFYNPYDHTLLEQRICDAFTTPSGLFHGVKPVAVGECGLQLRTIRGREETKIDLTQLATFRVQVRAAIRLHKPLVLHLRGDSPAQQQKVHLTAIRVLKEENFPQDLSIVNHCFTGDLTIAQEWSANFPQTYLSFSRKALNHPQISRVLEEWDTECERTLLETDSPVINFGQNRGRAHNLPRIPCDSADLHYPLGLIAQVRNHLDLPEIIKRIQQNTMRCYHLPEDAILTALCTPTSDPFRPRDDYVDPFDPPQASDAPSSAARRDAASSSEQVSNDPTMWIAGEADPPPFVTTTARSTGPEFGDATAAGRSSLTQSYRQQVAYGPNSRRPPSPPLQYNARGGRLYQGPKATPAQTGQETPNLSSANVEPLGERNPPPPQPAAQQGAADAAQRQQPSPPPSAQPSLRTEKIAYLQKIRVCDRTLDDKPYHGPSNPLDLTLTEARNKIGVEIHPKGLSGLELLRQCHVLHNRSGCQNRTVEQVYTNFREYVNNLPTQPQRQLGRTICGYRVRSLLHCVVMAWLSDIPNLPDLTLRFMREMLAQVDPSMLLPMWEKFVAELQNEHGVNIPDLTAEHVQKAVLRWRKNCKTTNALLRNNHGCGPVRVKYDAPVNLPSFQKDVFNFVNTQLPLAIDLARNQGRALEAAYVYPTNVFIGDNTAAALAEMCAERATYVVASTFLELAQLLDHTYFGKDVQRVFICVGREDLSQFQGEGPTSEYATQVDDILTTLPGNFPHIQVYFVHPPYNPSLHDRWVAAVGKSAIDSADLRTRGFFNPTEQRMFSVRPAFYLEAASNPQQQKDVTTNGHLTQQGQSKLISHLTYHYGLRLWVQNPRKRRPLERTSYPKSYLYQYDQTNAQVGLWSRLTWEQSHTWQQKPTTFPMRVPKPRRPASTERRTPITPLRDINLSSHPGSTGGQSQQASAHASRSSTPSFQPSNQQRQFFPNPTPGGAVAPPSTAASVIIPPQPTVQATATLPATMPANFLAFAQALYQQFQQAGALPQPSQQPVVQNLQPAQNLPPQQAVQQQQQLQPQPSQNNPPQPQFQVPRGGGATRRGQPQPYRGGGFSDATHGRFERKQQNRRHGY